MEINGTQVQKAYFVGIGGIGMSGIAEVMKNLGYAVQGSDVAEGYVVEGLRAKGIPVAIGHRAENLGDAAVIVTSTAIKRGNPEVEAALERRIPVERRAEMLAELMRLKHGVVRLYRHDNALRKGRCRLNQRCRRSAQPPSKRSNRALA